MWEKLSTSRQSKHAAAHAIGAAVAIVVALLTYRGVVVPLMSEADEHELHANRVRLLVARSEQVAAEHRQLRERQAKLTSAAKQTRDRMPTDVAAGDFVERSTALASQLDIEVEQCQSGAAELHDDHATIDVSCTLRGSFASICRYLAAIDQLPQASRVRRLQMAQSPESEGYPVQVTFQLYYQIDPHDKDQQRGAL
jgi:Tfp pilus assembly protein PilO